ncbi:metabotropic glutamate receptor [Lingula anatina]|uniref:Metabotropic glutamate receptor n=1 Tax=Lingula anatina TaxID=7574 RepID=A0A1S3JY51_LINAN|nr:metabotropic glutamate receptor [Lingula anatina]|eukprot:XP_013414979.1 metabotropic glutamate receptor [Lingula anatina]
MVDILNKFGWTYVSVLYVDSDYGETAAKTVRKLTKDFGICIAVDRVVSDSFQQSDWDLTVSMLLNARNARAVLLIMHISPAIELFKAVKRADAMGVFQWIGSDGVSVGIADLGDSADAAEGILTIRPGFDYAREFNTWFKGLHPAIRSDNPYFMEHWELYFDCSWTNGTGKPTCDEDNRMTEANGFAPMSFATLVIDTTLVFAHALHSLIEERCPGVVGQNVSKCINGSLLLKYLLEVEFQGHIGRVKFDKQGDILAQYDIEQLQNKSSDYKQVAVASWDADVGHVQLVDQNPIIWVTSESVSLETPESVCSKPCGKGEFYLQKELSCCWECRKCRNNEYLVSNQTSCKECPELMWPVESLTSCESVQPEHMRWGDSLAITILTFSIIGIILAAFILAFFIRHNNAKLIKACSRELAYLILTGVFVSYLTAIFFLAKPEDHFCYVEHFGFSLSFAWIYAPLFTRTNRIYRIFASGKKTKKRPPLVSPRSQVIIASLLITIEVIISIITAAVNPPGIEQRMPVKTEKFVELLCKLPIQGIVASLAYNILLVAMCSFYAFKTRKLPDNFNESKFISMCVYTTLVIWLAFIPTYFTTSAAYFRVVLLSVALILNATVVLAFLYAPKVYAIAYVDADTIQINQLNPTTSVSPLAGSSNMTSLQGQGRVAASITVEPRPFTAREATYEHHHDLAVATIS